MNSSPTVSVIIPAYNAAQFIGRTLASVSAQTYGDFEVIVVDDGSSDDTAEIVSSHPDPRVRLIQQANASQAAARNRGIAESKAPLIAFLDADDLWHQDKLKIQLPLMNKCQLSHTGVNLIDKNDRLIGSPKHKHFSKDVWRRILAQNFISCSSVLVSRTALDGLEGPFRVGIQGCEDWDLWLRIAKKGISFNSTSDRLLYYRIHTENTSKNIDLMLKSNLTVINDAGDPAQDLNLRKIQEYARYRTYLRMGHECRVQNASRSRALFFQAIQHNKISILPYWGILKTLLP